MEESAVQVAGELHLLDKKHPKPVKVSWAETLTTVLLWTPQQLVFVISQTDGRELKETEVMWKLI